MSTSRALRLPSSRLRGALGRAVVAMSLAVLPSLARAEGAPTVQQVIDGVEATYKDVHALQADFSQYARSAVMGVGPKQTGVVMLSRPRKMRWEFRSPDSKLFVTDGQTMWVYTLADKQVFVSQDLGGGDSGTDQLLENLDSLDELFDVSMLPGAPEDTVRLELTPRKATQFKKLQLQLSAGSYQLQELVVVDPFDNETVLSFSNLQVNPELAPSLFTFEVPDGVTVVSADGL